MPLQLTFEELDLLAGNVSNEVINGFEVDPFNEQIGLSRDDFKKLANRLRSEVNRQVSLDTQEAKIFQKALLLVLKELGPEEFQTRTGYEYDFGTLLLEKLSRSDSSD